MMMIKKIRIVIQDFVEIIRYCRQLDIEMSNFLDLSKDKKILENPKSKKIFVKRYTQNIKKPKVKEKNIFSSLNCKKEKLGI